MTNKMLIDASHPEETRVVVLRGNRVEEFDFESASRKPLRGNIYLAKVTRVEPSLQAAFVDYGGNRHGFLAFSEIHPDYYQIPVADRQALLEEETRGHDEEDDHRRERRSRRHRSDRSEKRQKSSDESISEEAALASEPFPVVNADESAPVEAETIEQHAPPTAAIKGEPESPDAVASAPFPLESAPTLENPAEPPVDRGPPPAESNEEQAASPHVIGVDPSGFATIEASEGAPEAAPAEPAGRRHAEEGEGDNESEDEHVEQVGGDAMEEVPSRPYRARRQYKIQEVIKRRQVLLVQVVKEERGNKGAALTTYLSLAGRYSVLMPNTARGGGISRKITDAGDRRRLKEIVEDLEVPEGMGIILRTAGAARTKPEVKRDFEYLLRMWENVRELTLRSTAPTLVYEEGSLIKRAIRDLYGKEIDEIEVAGEEAHREAREFMRMLMPSHVKHVKLYEDPQPIFAASGVESQLDAMFSNQVTLRSGGYLVINQTEALVAIDVNSGRSTREHNIEDTAVRTNCEASDEIARQLRLRDLAGLIVVDFIDMEENRNNRTVERRLKEALKNDRARIQVGRISHFGLLEMSRQRIRTGVLEGSTVPCPHCAGAGSVRSTSSIALHVLRVIEDALIKSSSHNIVLHTRTPVALYILNQKRAHLRNIEERFGVSITVAADDALTGTAYHAIERGEAARGVVESVRAEPLRMDSVPLPDEETIEEDADEGIEAEGGEDRRPAGDSAGEEAEAQRRRRRRRRGRGRGGDRDGQFLPADAPQPSDDGLAYVAATTAPQLGQVEPREDGIEDTPESETSADTAENARSRRPRRGGRGRRPDRDSGGFERGRRSGPPGEPREQFDRGPGYWAYSERPGEAGGVDQQTVAPAARDGLPAESFPAEPVPPELQDGRHKLTQAQNPIASAAATEASIGVQGAAESEAPPPRRAPAQPPEHVLANQKVITEADPDRPKRGGWWQRAKATLTGGE
ncbi:MAG: ribonuclease [Methylobacteriaceae bacterium]|nr:ribonuclease [Methylobacteriaceae bacterium]